jgi:coproporphyrinogen III oxidase
LTDASLTGTSDTSIYSITTANGPGGGTDIYLNDGTTILLKGVNVSHVYSTTLQGATGVITAIGYK